jgi:hypothetical protein
MVKAGEMGGHMLSMVTGILFSMTLCSLSNLKKSFLFTMMMA